MGFAAGVTQDHKPVLARFSVAPTPPLPTPLIATPPFSAPDGSFAYYPQLKFFELAGHDLVNCRAKNIWANFCLALVLLLYIQFGLATVQRIR